MRTQRFILGLLAATLVGGCLTKPVVYVSDAPPARPTGVNSITGDEAVYLYWNPNSESDLDFYCVYRSYDFDGPYKLIGETVHESFVDYEVANGYTYHYAVAAVDYRGQISQLSTENVHDTPRPEGFDLFLHDLADSPSRSGFDLSGQRRVAFDDPRADIFVDGDAESGLLYINAANLYTDIQDMGYTDSFDDITWAPRDGWSPVGWCQLIEGHTYVVWTDQNHFAKLRAVVVASAWARFDWAYQVDPGNPELVKPAHDSGYLRRPTAVQPSIPAEPAR